MTIPRNIFTGTDSDFGLRILREMDSNAVIWGYTAWEGSSWKDELRELGVDTVVGRQVPFKDFAERMSDFLGQHRGE